jgi:phosphatidylglycerol:prolipoprotein diacylglycerol transferase
MIFLHKLSPICCRIFGIDVYWYGISYVLSFFFALFYTKSLASRYTPDIPPKYLDDFFLWACLGTILGGRLGHCLFFEGSYFLAHPLEIFYIRNGGMAFHGGLLGVCIAALGFCRQRKVPLWRFFDLLASAAPIGLALGRVANFINGELYGLPCHSFGVFFPGIAEPRHPTQLYEAASEGILTFVLLRLGWFVPYFREKPGQITAFFALLTRYRDFFSIF